MSKKSLTLDVLKSNCKYLRLNFLAENLEEHIEQLIAKKITNTQFFEEMIASEVTQKQDRSLQRRIKMAKIGLLKTLDEYRFYHPSQINEEKVRHHNRLSFIEQKKNIIIIGTVGLGKTHIAKSYLHQACIVGYTCLFSSAAEILEDLMAAQERKELNKAIKKYIKPQCLVIDELGFIPIDKHGCDLFFQVISRRHEQNSTIITSNRTYKQWCEIFNNDAIVTSAILDRILENSDTIIIEGTSYRMRDRSKDIEH